MTTLSRPTVLALAAGLMLALAGCGGNKPVPVNGTVKLDGQPLASGRIEFRTPDGKGVVAGTGITNGEYNFSANSGPPPGSYKVSISASKKTGKQIPAGSPSPPGTMVDETVEAIPDQYNKKSTLVKDVVSGPNTINFELTSK
jgi:hypothetical protein